MSKGTNLEKKYQSPTTNNWMTKEGILERVDELRSQISNPKLKAFVKGNHYMISVNDELKKTGWKTLI